MTIKHIGEKDMWAGPQTKMIIKNLYGIINDHTMEHMFNTVTTCADIFFNII
jgi:hypothetical protein